MNRKILTIILSIIACLTLTIGVFGCQGTQRNSQPEQSSSASLGATSSQSSLSQGGQSDSSLNNSSSIEEIKPSSNSSSESSFVESSSSPSTSVSSAKMVTITIKLNNGSQDLVYQVQENSNLASYEPTNFTYLNKIFIGWYCGGEVFDFNSVATQDLIIEAMWKEPAPLPPTTSSSSSSSKEPISSQPPFNVRDIRLYKNETEYTVRKYVVGNTVNVADWLVPEVTFEGKVVPFIGWWNEAITEQVTGSFTMPSKSMAFYAMYDYPAKNLWSYDNINKVYTSNGAGVRAVEDVKGGLRGEYKATLKINNTSTTAIGIIWNATIADVDNPYDHTTGSSYWYMHLNPTNGGFQLAQVLTDYVVAGGVNLANTPTAWQTKWSAYKLNGGTLEVEFKVVYDSSSINLYVDGDLLLTYTGELIGSLTGTQVGMRTNTAGNQVVNAEYKELNYADSYAWSYNETDKTYTSTGVGIAPTIDKLGATYGTYSASLTVANNTTTGVGIIWNASIADVDKPYDHTTGSSYWYMHLNPQNGGFQLAQVSTAYSAIKTVLLANGPTAWQTKWNAWNNGGKTTNLIFEMKVEFMPTYIRLYIDGDLLYTYEGDKLGTITGKSVGFRTNKADNVVKDISFTPWTYNWSPSLDGTSYTSVGKGIMLTNANAGTIGTYSVDFTIGEKTTTSLGILFNATVPSSVDKPYESGCSYYYLNLNINSGANFQLAKVDGTYLSLAYIQKTTLTNWNTKYNAWNDGGRVDTLTFNLKVEFCETSISVYVDDELITTYTGDNVGKLTGSGVGVRSSLAGNTISNVTFTPAING
ncbi:MAG: hypothetical protein J6C97_04395 [Clostridia bacterium]|nr:hypothetical protein [Clostridia bacterium]